MSNEQRGRLVLLVMCVGYFLVLLDVTVVNVALPRIDADLDAGVDGLQWVVDAYAVALAALLLVGGAVGDVRGHRRIVLTGLTIFAAASLACGLAPTIGVLLASRAVQGVGAALLLPGTLAIIVDSATDRQARARAIGVWAAVGSCALPAGPLVGGALVDAIGWRAVFVVNVPIAVAAAMGAVRIVADDRPASRRPVDWAGATLAALTLATLVFAIIELGRSGVEPAAVVSIAATLALGVAFVLVEQRQAEPMMPLSMFRRLDFTSATLIAGTMNLGTLGLLFVVTLYLQSVHGDSPLRAGIALLPLFLPLTVIAPLAGRLTARRGPRLPMAAGLGLAAVGVALMTRLEPDSPYSVLLPAILGWGIGIGLLTPAVVAAAVGAVDPGRSGLASGVNNTSRQAAGAVGVAAYGAVAGRPAHVATFVAGLHHLAVATTVLFGIAALVAIAVTTPGGDP
jgi:DHA2 family methylenomycin A resistance protein-like MFS transporter